jgi:prefoldin subunit 5
MASTESQVEKIQKHFQTLSDIASSLNAASDELTQAVGVLDEALKKLNIGLSVWVIFRSRSEEDSPEIYDLDQIGYCKVNGTWGIAIQRIWGDESIDRHDSEGPWLFRDASREMRVQAVDKIPELIEALGKQASETKKAIEEKTKQVKNLAEAIRGDSSKNKVVVKGVSLGQVEGIISIVNEQQKFLGELVRQAHLWERAGDTLRVYFSSEKRPFAEMLQGRDSLLKFHNAVQQILGASIQIGVQTEQQLVPMPQRASKVQK